MKKLSYLLLGFAFGIVIFKSEAMTWYRIQEMFRFQSFHMYGIFASILAVGIISVFLIRTFNLKTIYNEEITLKPKPLKPTANTLGGLSFGAGWALTGCCVGPLYLLVGYGIPAAFVILMSAFLGVFVYGATKSKLPH